MTAQDHTVAAVDRWKCTITAEGGDTVSPIDHLWNFFILSGLQPQPQQRLLAYQRAQALRAPRNGTTRERSRCSTDARSWPSWGPVRAWRANAHSQSSTTAV